MRPETAAIHAARPTGGPVSPPIVLSTTFEHGPAYEQTSGYAYVREDSPNVANLETRLAAMEQGCGAVAFASGMAAASALFSTLPRGSDVLFHNDSYFAYRRLSEEVLPQWGLSGRFLDFKDEAALETALKKRPSLLCFETPSNPLMDVLDIAKLSAQAHDAGAKVMIDGSFATPALQQPLDLGADYVMHALTKYIGGHSDMQGGVIIARDETETLERLVLTRTLTGGVLAPFNAWMLSRGLETLFARMARHSDNALMVASALETNKHIERVRYVFLESHPQIDLARNQMSAGGGMVSIDVKGGRDDALHVASRVRLFTNATSFGGAESLIEHRPSVEGEATLLPQNSLRLSIGLEHPDDLIEDLEQALG
ncbi:MAG: aminotransferase class I/II-fold pyridoxal phosphate-dependent enzyme [Pseudomonadota bacterium]